ncbi:MAG: hypothetical protein RLZZ305_5 [Actinomycetota bacterium]|jgi:copper transport protein
MAVVLWLVPGPAVASRAPAHAVLEYSKPAASSIVEEPPARIELGFSEPVDAGLSDVRLFDADKKEIEVGAPVRPADDGAVLVADVPLLAPGAYVVVWRITSSDGHPSDGAFPFEVGKTSSGLGYGLVQDATESAGHASPLGVPLAVARFLSFAGFVLLAGALVLSWGTAMLGSRRVAQSAAAGAVLSIIGAFSVFALQGPWVTGGGWGDVISFGSAGEVASSRLGLAVIVRAVLMVPWLALVRAVRRSGWTGTSGSAAGVLLLITAATFSLSGHPGAEPGRWLWVPVDLVHLLAVAMWAGGVAVLVLARRDIESGAHGGLVVGRFSQSSTVALPVAVLTGVAQGLHLTDGPAVWPDTRYGVLLIGKIVLAVLAVFLGARARRRVRAGRGSELAALLRVEAVVAAVVLGLAAGLVSSSPRGPGTGADSFAVTLVQESVIADVAVVPPRIGDAELHLMFSPPGGALSPVANVSARISMPSHGIAAVAVTMAQTGANHWTGTLSFPEDGDWTLEILAAPSANSQVRYSTVIPVGE